MSPMARLRELPRQNLSALAESVILLPLVVALVYLAARDKLPAYLALPMKSVPAAVAEVAAGVGGLLWKGAALFLVFGLVDLMRQRRRYARDLRMSRQEIRDELKEMEGDPHIKARIRALRRDLLRRRMMGEVPKATAVVVNPTHYAVALRYQMNSTSAPTVVAKGKNYLALRIRQKALEHEVPLVENPPLAQALYHTTQVGQEIPAQLFRAVAEVLAYVYRVMQGRLPG